MGGGMGGLRKLIPDNHYVSVDKEKWTPETIVADFNKGEFPDFGRLPRQFDVIVCQGVIEYMVNANAFLSTVKMYGKQMIATYYTGDKNISDRKNYFSQKEIRIILGYSGWRILRADKISKEETLYFCSL